MPHGKPSETPGTCAEDGTDEGELGGMLHWEQEHYEYDDDESSSLSRLKEPFESYHTEDDSEEDRAGPSFSANASISASCISQFFDQIPETCLPKQPSPFAPWRHVRLMRKVLAKTH